MTLRDKEETKKVIDSIFGRPSGTKVKVSVKKSFSEDANRHIYEVMANIAGGFAQEMENCFVANIETDDIRYLKYEINKICKNAMVFASKIEFVQ